MKELYQYKWISVDDKLPKEGEEILAIWAEREHINYMKKKEKPKYKTTWSYVVTTFRFQSGKPYWPLDEGYNCHPDYWMPLPKPPRYKEKDEDV